MFKLLIELILLNNSLFTQIKMSNNIISYNVYLVWHLLVLNVLTKLICINVLVINLE